MANDSAIDDLNVAAIKQLRSEKRFAEAFDRSTELTRAEPGNLEGWWCLTLAATDLKHWEAARDAAKETIKLAPRWLIAWAQYGFILEALKCDDEAHKAFGMAIRIDPKYSYGYRHLLDISKRQPNPENVIHYGQMLERLGEADAKILDEIGSAFWDKKNWLDSLFYYRKSATLEKRAFRYQNQGSLYQRPEISQAVDAADAYRRGLLLEPDNEQIRKAFAGLSKTLSALAQAVKQLSTQILDSAEFYRFYVNPFVLLGCDSNLELDDYPPKIIQRLKKELGQEIDLESGKLESLGGHVFSKPQAFDLCDELLDDIKKNFHWVVFQDIRLWEFLHTGDIKLFTHEANYFPVSTLNALDDPAFLRWLSKPFAQQYDLVLCRALDKNVLATISVLLSGRRYVAQENEDLCFAGARRNIDRRMEPLRIAETESATKRPAISVLSEMVVDSKNPQALAPLFNLLPIPFRSFKHEAVRLIRMIAVNCNNKHSDPDLARDVLQLAKAFASAGLDAAHQIETDEQKVNEIIAKEREHEVRLTQAGTPLEITREGVRKGEAFIASKELEGVRWGITIKGQRPLQTYSFYLSVLSEQRSEISISWSATENQEKNQETFFKLIDGLCAYALPFIITKINSTLDNNTKVIIGNCELTGSYIVIPTAGWLGAKRHETPWSRVQTELVKGDVIVSDRENSKIRTAMPLGTTYNAMAIERIAALRGK